MFKLHLFVEDQVRNTLFAYKEKRYFVPDLASSYFPSAIPEQVNTNTTKYNKQTQLANTQALCFTLVKWL